MAHKPENLERPTWDVKSCQGCVYSLYQGAKSCQILLRWPGHFGHFYVKLALYRKAAVRALAASPTRTGNFGCSTESRPKGQLANQLPASGLFHMERQVAIVHFQVQGSHRRAVNSPTITTPNALGFPTASLVTIGLLRLQQ